MKKINKEKAITLIALVITIVILIILAGVLINVTLGKNGIIDKTKEAKIAHIKAQYYDEINIEILEEQMERQINQKSEAFIVSLDNRLKTKSWRKNSIICDTNNNENSNPFDNTILIVETVEDYEIYIEVDNEKNSARIEENSYKQISEPCTIRYDSNGGEGTTEGPTTIRKGFKITLPENGFTKSEYEFAGWTLDSENTGKTYSAGSQSDSINEDTTFYAKWSRNVVTIEYDKNGGEGTMETTPATVGEETTLRENTFTPPTGYEFEKWTTKADGSGNSYTDNITITDNTNASIKLYAQWKIIEYTITYELDNGSLPEGVSNPTTYTVKTEDFTLPTPTRANYTFTGWTGSNGTTPQTTVTIAKGTTGNKSYTANWKANVVTINWASNLWNVQRCQENGSYNMTGTYLSCSGYGSYTDKIFDTKTLYNLDGYKTIVLTLNVREPARGSGMGIALQLFDSSYNCIAELYTHGQGNGRVNTTVNLNISGYNGSYYIRFRGALDGTIQPLQIKI